MLGTALWPLSDVRLDDRYRSTPVTLANLSANPHPGLVCLHMMASKVGFATTRNYIDTRSFTISMPFRYGLSSASRAKHGVFEIDKTHPTA